MFNVEVRLFATLRQDRGKVLNVKWQENMNGYDVIKELNIDEKDVSVFLINGHRSSLDKPLNHDDIIAIFPPVGGG